MAGNRGDDIVLAGSGGQRASATLSAIFDQTHRSTALILAIDSLIIVLIAWDFASVSQQYIGRGAMLMWAIPLFITTSTWFSYRSRRRWAYWPAAMIIAIAAVIFFLLFLANLYATLGGAAGGILFMLIMGYASFSSFQRFVIISLLSIDKDTQHLFQRQKLNWKKARCWLHVQVAWQF